MAILEFKFSMIQLQESLDITSMGKLSSVLINPYNLSVILQQVSLQVPAGLSTLTGLTLEEMYVYYTVTKVYALATSKSIRFLLIYHLRLLINTLSCTKSIPYPSSTRALVNLL
jgi:hypothetical protein